MKTNISILQKIFILFSFVFVLSTNAQAPEKMSYQAVIRNAGNALVTNQSIGMRISILQTTATGTAVYVETQTTTTNANGLASIEIGAGTVVSGTFANINWGADKYFIKTETDPAGGTNYNITGTSQLLSAPYALHAKSAKNGIPTGGTTGQVLSKVNGTDYNTQWVTPSAVSVIVRASANTAQQFSLGTNFATPDIATCFGNVITNIGSAFNPTTGIFTAPSDGLYLVTIQAASTNGVVLLPYIDVNNDFTNSAAPTANDFFGVGYTNSAALATITNQRGQLSATVYLTANQIFSIRFQNATTVLGGIVRTDGATNFTIVKLN